MSHPYTACPSPAAGEGEVTSVGAVCNRDARDAKSLLQVLGWFFVLAWFLGGCQSRPQPEVRVDINRAAQTLTLSPLSKTPLIRLPAVQMVQPADSLALMPVESPPPAEAVSLRRQTALSSIEQQRDAVRQRLLELRLQPLSELEQRWRAELRASYDLDALRAELDTAWQEAFQQYGRRRFPLIVALIFTAPDSDARRHTQAQLDQLDRAWQTQERTLRARYEARLARIDQEIEVRLNARRREFIRNAEQEAREQLAQQPDPVDLYLPQPQSLPPAPARKEDMPSLASRLPARTLEASLNARRTQTESTRREMLTQLAQEWAEVNGYRLTNAPSASDRTDEFVRYLLAK
ncbi:MAG: hypothetical protein KatS3mg019_1084 [Fimbriimonadales bacterium]|nr:MAG: hypothetical protein KatS3mg019_1084 [Fimbriimonadales bacterium]